MSNQLVAIFVLAGCIIVLAQQLRSLSNRVSDLEEAKVGKRPDWE